MRLEELSDVRLLANLDTRVSSQRTCMADIVAHLAELDSRPVVLARGYPSLSSTASNICASVKTKRVGVSKARAYRGDSPRSSLRSRPGFPTPDLPERIRQLPTPKESARSGLVQPDPGTTDTSRGAEVASGTIPLVLVSPPTLARDAHRSRLEPLSQDRFALRAIVEKEGLRCSFVGIDGRRCECRAFLEFDHIEPFGLDGSHGEDNVRLLCRAHNQYAATRIYGAVSMRRWRSSATRACPASTP
jgi:hypothetical protein